LNESIETLVKSFANPNRVITQIEKDLNYNPADDKKRKKRDPRGHQREQDARKSIR